MDAEPVEEPTEEAEEEAGIVEQSVAAASDFLLDVFTRLATERPGSPLPISSTLQHILPHLAFPVPPASPHLPLPILLVFTLLFQFLI